MFKILFITGLFLFALNLQSFAMMCGGHSQHQQTAQAKSGEHKHTEYEATMKTTKEAVNVGNKICPVSGEKIKEDEKFQVEHEGKIYNLCCKMCLKDFKKDPEKYIKKLEEMERKEKLYQEEHEGHSEHHGGHHE